MWRKVGAETETVGAVTEGGHLPRTPLKDNCYHFTIFTQPLYSHIVNIGDLPPIATFSWGEISMCKYHQWVLTQIPLPWLTSHCYRPSQNWFLKSKHKHNRLEMTQYFSLGLVFCCCWGAAKITCCPPHALNRRHALPRAQNYRQ